MQVKPRASTAVADGSTSTCASTSVIGTPDQRAAESMPNAANAPFPEHSIT